MIANKVKGAAHFRAPLFLICEHKIAVAKIYSDTHREVARI